MYQSEQKAAMIGAPVVVALLARTALAHCAAGARSFSIARSDEFEVVIRPSRTTLEKVQRVARGRPSPTRSA